MATLKVISILPFSRLLKKYKDLGLMTAWEVPRLEFSDQQEPNGGATPTGGVRLPFKRCRDKGYHSAFGLMIYVRYLRSVTTAH